MKQNKKVLLSQEQKFLKPRHSKYIGENSKRDTFTLRKDLNNFNESYELQMRRFKSAVRQNLASHTPMSKFAKEFLIISIVLVASALYLQGKAYKQSSNHEQNIQINKNNHNIPGNVISFLSFFAFLLFMLPMVDAAKQIKVSRKVNSFYNHIFVRHFKQLQKKNPKLSDDILLSLNPELSEIVGQTLVHDLSEQDFNKLVKIATHFYNTKQKDNIDKFDGLIENAVKIISDATVRNPFLLDKLLYVYQGNFPQTYLYSPQIKSAKTM